MKKVDLLANVPPEEPNKDEVVANIFEADKQPVLELTWIDTVSMEPHLIRHFVWKGHYLTYRGKRAYSDPKWSEEQYNTALTGLFHTYGCYGSASDSVAGAVMREFLDKINAQERHISSYETGLAWDKKNKAEGRKQKRITARVNEITPPLPKGFISWAKKQKTNYIYLLQWNGHQTVDRRFERNILGADTIISEYVRGYSYTAGQVWDEHYYGEFFNRYGKNQRFWDKKCGYGVCDRKGVLYPGTLSEIPWESMNAYRAIREDAEKGTAANYGACLRRYQTDEKAEKIVKSGYPALADIWRKGSLYLFDVKPNEGINVMLNITKGRYRLLRKLNAGVAVIYAAQEGTLERPYFSDKELILLNKVPGEQRKRKIRDLAKAKHLPLSHLIKLLGKASLSKISEYNDYLSMAGALGENIHDEIVYRNKRWKEYHDRHVAELEKIKADKRKKEVDQKYRRIRAKAEANRRYFGWQTEGFVMMVPERASDIVTEGRIQHHCVGSSDTYIKRMNEGKTFILFLRKEEEKDTPFYTIEAMTDGTILQAYGAYDRKPDWKTVKPVLDKWKKEMRKRAREENNERVSVE